MTVAFINKKTILKEIRHGNEDALVRIYLKHKSEFIGWAIKKFNLSQEESEDIYQDTILAFRNNIVSGKLVELHSSVKTYLFAVAKNLALKKKNHFTNQFSEQQADKEPITPMEESVVEVLADHERQQIISSIINKLREPNRSILKMYYYQNLSMREIAEKLNYKNYKVVKAQKVRCMNELKKIIQELSLKEVLKD